MKIGSKEEIYVKLLCYYPPGNIRQNALFTFTVLQSSFQENKISKILFLLMLIIGVDKQTNFQMFGFGKVDLY